MMKVLVHLQQQPRAGTSLEGIASILNYHFGWKTVRPFHLKILPYLLKDFRSTILHHIQIPNVQVAERLMSDTSLCTEYEQHENKLKFIKENIDHSSDAFHILKDGRYCSFYISRRTYSIVAVNGIDMSTCEHPYYEAYHYGRMLETCFTKDVVGGVSFGVDHSDKKIWVWADCDENEFEAKVLSPHQVVKTGEFQKYCKTAKPFEQKSESCKAVHMDRILIEHLDESDVKQFFSKCGKILRIELYQTLAGFTANVHFADTIAVDKAMHGTAGRIIQRFKDSPQILPKQGAEAQMTRLMSFGHGIYVYIFRRALHCTMHHSKNRLMHVTRNQ